MPNDIVHLQFKSMNTLPEATQINQLIVEYLRSMDMQQTLEVMEQEIKNKYSAKKNRRQELIKPDQVPRVCTLLKNVGVKSRREINFQRDARLFVKKYGQVLSASKQVFGVTVSLLQLLSSLREASRSELAEAIENYKIQLAKYHKVLLNEGKSDRDEVTEVVMLEHKTKLDKYFLEKNTDGITEVLLSFRVNALQIAPQLRKNLVYELIRNDVFKIEDTEKFDFLLALIDNPHPQLRYAIIALVSIVSSTLRGVEYLIFNNNMVVIQRIIKILKQQQNSSVLQRFCLALLQKCSIKQSIIPTFIENDMINWLMALIRKSTTSKIHQFSLDFGSALLANIIHTPSTLQYLERNITFAQHLMESMLKLIRDNIQVSVLMHILICLSYLSKQPFKTIVQNCNFVDRISEFVEFYSQINTSENEGAEIDKRTVLDLCAHMFHPKDSQLQNSQTMELNQLKTEDRIRQYENEQGELIFQCFQDEV